MKKYKKILSAIYSGLHEILIGYSSNKVINKAMNTYITMAQNSSNYSLSGFNNFNNWLDNFGLKQDFNEKALEQSMENYINQTAIGIPITAAIVSSLADSLIPFLPKKVKIIYVLTNASVKLGSMLSLYQFNGYKVNVLSATLSVISIGGLSYLMGKQVLKLKNKESKTKKLNGGDNKCQIVMGQDQEGKVQEQEED